MSLCCSESKSDVDNLGLDSLTVLKASTEVWNVSLIRYQYTAYLIQPPVINIVSSASSASPLRHRDHEEPPFFIVQQGNS